jgi:prepilin-type N-terminal cleavage/methylation domain-containing protein
MRTRSATIGRRVGFTLIELLVVIAIIGILVSLLMAAVMKTMSKMEEVRTRNDITQLSQAIDSFKTKYKVDYIPSRIVLGPRSVYYDGSGNLRPGIYADSFQYLNRVWPRLDWTGNSGPIVWSTAPGYTPGANGITLEGQECLVFFLGGIPGEPGGNRGCFGFSKSPTNPTLPPAAGQDRDTFYDFLSNRLKTRNEYAVPTVAAPGVGFYAYLDAYGKQPYAYFSSYKSANQYNRYAGTDCPHLRHGPANTDGGVFPYAENWDPNRKYLNSNTYQIISAGADGIFGPGTTTAATVWRQGQQNLSPTQPGYDDMCNFSDRLLGIPTN